MIKLKTILVRHPINYDQVLADQKQMIHDLNTHVEEFKIDTVLELSHKKFEEFKSNLSCSWDFIKEHDDIFLVKENGSDDYSGLIVDAQGFDYPRYVGIPMQEVDIKKCPLCSHYYVGHPALSRKDNKTEICPACGVTEALESFGYDKNFINFLKSTQQSADEFNARIIIQVPDKDDIVIEPNK